MKKILIAIILLVAILGIAYSQTKLVSNNDYIRIHIRANSNQDIDQNVKLKVKDIIVEELIPLLAEAKTTKEAKVVLKNNLKHLEKIANEVLRTNSFDYSANAVMRKEEFPTRMYGDLVLEKGEYESLILNLGDGKGDNWWCVAFPPLCFIPTNGEKIKYKSKILEIINKFFKDK